MISIVVAVKNEITHIEECFESLQNQNFLHYDIIFVDGGSTDGTREFLEKRVTANKKTKIFDNPKGDAAAGRNIGISHSSGEIIAFIDSDAVADSNWLANIKAGFDQIKDETIAGIGGPGLIPKSQPFKSYAIAKIMSSPLASGGILNPSAQHKVIAEKRIVKHIPTSNLAIKRSILEKEGGFDERFTKGQDLEFSTKLVKRGYKFLYDPEIKVWHYRKKSFIDFSRQVYKWAAAKGLVMKKHGWNFGYLLPIIVLGIAFLIFLLSLISPYFAKFLFLFTSVYILTILIESVRISLKNIKLFFYAILIFPLIHLSYALGLLKGLFKKL